MKRLKTYGKFTDVNYKKFNESLQDILDEGFFYNLQDEGFAIVERSNKSGVKSGIQSHIKIFKPKNTGQLPISFDEMQIFNFEEIKSDVIRFLELTSIEVEVEFIYVSKKYVSKKIPSTNVTIEDMLYDPKGVTRFRSDPLLHNGNNKILDDNYDIGDILQLVIVYGFI